MTAAFVVTWKGRIIAERYGDGITPTHAARELVDGQEPDRHADGHADQAGRLRLWSSRRRFPSGRRRATRARRSASPTSCTCRAGCGSSRRRIPTTIRTAPIPITSTSTRAAIDSFKYAATRPLQWPPNTVGRYRNTDPVLTNYLIRLALEKRSEDYHVVPAARAVRQDRHPHDGDGDRSVRQLPDAGLRARRRPRLGAARQPLSAGRRVERRAHPARGLRQVRQHARAGVGGGQAARSTAASSGSTATARSRCRRRRTTWRRRRPDDADHSVARSRRRAPRPLQGRRPRAAERSARRWRS